MRNLISGLMIPAICLSLAAESTGRLAGTVKTKSGVAIPNAVLLLERADIKWSKEVKVSDKGTFMQVGLEPREFNITVSAPGYAPMKIKRKVPLAETLTENIVLLTPDEARAENLKNPAEGVNVGEAKDSEGSANFNQGVGFYNEQKYAEALPFIEKAYKAIQEAVATIKDADAKAEAEAKLPTIERVYGILLVETAKGDATKKAQMLCAEPFLVRANAKAPTDQRVLLSLIEVAKAKADPVMQKQYQGALDTLLGPRPELAYNDAVTAFNGEKYKEAKVFLTKAIEADPKFADSYYLLGVVEFSLGNPKAAKEAFKQYQIIAPTGKKAGEVRDFLKELK